MQVQKKTSAGLGFKAIYINSQFRNTSVRLFSHLEDLEASV